MRYSQRETEKISSLSSLLSPTATLTMESPSPSTLVRSTLRRNSLRPSMRRRDLGTSLLRWLLRRR